MVGKALPSYQKPPVVEVACGVAFEPLNKIRIPHVGLLWEKFRGNFPKCEHAPPIRLGEEMLDDATGLPLPRIWFVNGSGDQLIQLQINRFLYNWRKQQTSGVYPRYEKIIAYFREAYSTFKSFLDENQLGPVNLVDCELTYVNHIIKGEGWETSQDIKDVLPDLSWRLESRFLQPPLAMAWQSAFRLPENRGRLSVKLNYGTRKIDSWPIYILELSALGLGADKTDEAMWSWFDLAHEWIVLGFADLTGEEIQKTAWGRL